MKPIEPVELSAYLDGELEPCRVCEVEAALANDPALRAEYHALANAEGVWKSAASSAAFEPNIQLRQSRLFTDSPFAFTAMLALLIVLRIAPKLSDVVALGILLHASALAIALPWIVRMARES